jgi:hypothetical protein
VKTQTKIWLSNHASSHQNHPFSSNINIFETLSLLKEENETIVEFLATRPTSTIAKSLIPFEIHRHSASRKKSQIVTTFPLGGDPGLLPRQLEQLGL